MQSALYVSCSCESRGYVMVEDTHKDYYTKCYKCQKKILGLNCPKCESGYAFPEGSKSIKGDSWKCDICSKENKISEDALNNYIPLKTGNPPKIDYEEELEKELKREIEKGDEKFIRHYVVNYFLNNFLKIKSIVWLIITDKRLVIMTSIKAGIDESISYDKIESVKKKNVLLISPTGLEIKLKSGEIKRFGIWKRRNFLENLSRYFKSKI
jgi:hypothetical protein